MDGMVSRWVIEANGLATGTAAPADAEGAIASALGVEPVVARVLAARGFADPARAAAFARPPLRGLHDPAALPDVDRAADRLLAALRRGETIAIYGDYDVDGVAATAILHHALRAIEPEASLLTYVPHRLDEGYGLNEDAIATLAAAGASVIVSVDCGITAFAEAERARRLGIDLIITDHHALPHGSRGLPEAFAIVHPAAPGSAYPCADLCGAGVAFKLAWRLACRHAGGERVGEPLRETLLELLALAALGTIADVVPLTGENRIIARYGLMRAGSSRLTGLRALLEGAELPPSAVDAEDAAFLLAPRLNAAGRMGHAAEAVELFSTAGPERAHEIVAALNRLNRERQGVERRIFEEACARAESAGMTGPESRAIVLADPSWHPGVVGIVCARLVRRFARPAILLHDDGALCRGSGRSIDGFDLHAALARCADELAGYGGHAMAAGMSLRSERLARFTTAFAEEAAAGISRDMLARRLVVDCEAGLDELTPLAARQLDALGPYGRGNPRPRLLLRDLVADRDARMMGSSGRHLSVQVRGGGRVLRLVGWGWGDRASTLRAGAVFDAVARVRLGTWQGCTRVEAEIEDLRIGGSVSARSCPRR